MTASASAPSRPTLPPAATRPLPIRKLGVDLRQGFARHWHGGDAFRTQFFNALSMSFPVGEQFFMDAVRQAVPLLPQGPEHAPLRAALDEALRGFIGQEATHRHIHAQYNAHLEQQGLDNRWQHWARARIALLQRRAPDPRHALAITAAYEHYTALLADGTLRYPRWLDGADPVMQTVWRWHAAEETEHRSVAFDLYRAIGGDERWRKRWFVYISLVFIRDALRQTVLNLWRDGTLWRPSTWWNGLRLFWGPDGLVWRCVPAALRYLRSDFHPERHVQTPDATALAADWLAANAGQFRVVR